MESSAIEIVPKKSKSQEEIRVYGDAEMESNKMKTGSQTDVTKKRPLSVSYILHILFCVLLTAGVLYIFIQSFEMQQQRMKLLEKIENQNRILREKIENKSFEMQQQKNELLQIIEKQNKTLGERIENQKMNLDLIKHKTDTILSQRYVNLSDGWFSLLNGYVYKMVSTTQSWDRSREICVNWGGDLVVYGVQNMQSRELFLKLFGFSNRYWIGSIRRNNTWYWINNDDIVNESSMYWKPGEPNNFGGNEVCAEISVDYALLCNDVRCLKSAQALCEKRI